MNAEELKELLVGRKIIKAVINDDEEFGPVVEELHLSGDIILYLTGQADRAQVWWIRKIEKWKCPSCGEVVKDGYHLCPNGPPAHPVTSPDQVRW